MVIVVEIAAVGNVVGMRGRSSERRASASAARASSNVVVLGRRGEREVRRYERHEQHPGLAARFTPSFAQPDLRLRADLLVVEV